jgi:hypothetical protein
MRSIVEQLYDPIFSLCWNRSGHRLQLVIFYLFLGGQNMLANAGFSRACELGVQARHSSAADVHKVHEAS